MCGSQGVDFGDVRGLECGRCIDDTDRLRGGWGSAGAAAVSALMGGSDRVWGQFLRIVSQGGR